MPKIAGNEIRPGLLIQHDGGLWMAVKTQAVKPGKGGAYNQVELKNVVTGTKLNERFRADETVEEVYMRRATRLLSWISRPTTRSNSMPSSSATRCSFCRTG